MRPPEERGVVAQTVSGGDRPQEQTPSTLAEAREMLRRQRPKRDAGVREWIAFHRHSATVYAQTAKVDLPHRQEATQCAGLAIRRARTIEDRLGGAGDQA
jgi:hypothetical protein